MMKKILVLAPHTDDGELGCGGSMSRFAHEGTDILYAAFSFLPEFNHGILREEATKAAEILGIQLEVFNYPVRRFPEHRQDILEDMVKLNADFAPELVFVPSRQDIHQDHGIVTAEAMRAFKHTTILGYELPWNNFIIETTAFTRLMVADVERKIQAMECYESQKQRPYMDMECIHGLARIRGIQAGTRYAEAFSVLRWVM